MILKLLKILIFSLLFLGNIYGQNAWNQLSLDVSPAPLDLRVGGRGDIQIWRNGSTIGQLYYPYGDANGTCNDCYYMYNGPFMTANTRAFVPYNYSLDGYHDEWEGDVSNISGSGTVADPWVISSHHENSTNGKLGFDMVYKYVNGTEFIDVEMTPFVPNNNNRTIKVYHIMDTYLSGSDTGPAYTSGSAPYDLVGVLAADSSIFEAFVVTDDPWDRYASHDYYDLLNEPYYDQDLSNTLDTDPDTDNAIGVQWTLGVVTGTQPTIKYRIGFTTDIGSLIGCEKSYINKQIGKTIKASGG